MTSTGKLADTPLFDGLLGDRLAEARAAIDLAQQDAQQFRAGLTRSAADALEQQAQERARELVQQRTATQDSHLAALERRLRATEQALVAADTELAALRNQATTATRPGLNVVAPPAMAAASATASPEPAPVQVQLVPPPAATPLPAPATPAASQPQWSPGRVTVFRLARRHDEGPAAADVPSVPSMNDIFATTRAASWLDKLAVGGR